MVVRVVRAGRFDSDTGRARTCPVSESNPSGFVDIPIRFVHRETQPQSVAETKWNRFIRTCVMMLVNEPEENYLVMDSWSASLSVST